jgi:hypothetical protein
MGRHAKTIAIRDAAAEVLRKYWEASGRAMTLRQTFYRLVSGLVLENIDKRYKTLSDILRDARKEGVVPWEHMEDRLRRPRGPSMWDGLADFADTAVRAYRRNVWATQPKYLECWLEKDALSGIFEELLDPYGVTLQVGRGFDGWSSIKDAAARYRGYQDVGIHTTILYYGDFDPSGEEMVRSLRERIEFFEVAFDIVKCALTLEQIEEYKLPPQMTKSSDSRAPKFVEKYGEVSSVELDALPPDALRALIVDEVEARMDLDALERIRHVQKRERAKLAKLLGGEAAP